MPTVYVTAPREDADELAHLLVSERLAACVNLIDCESTYRWEDQVHEEPEAILLAKTTEDACETLIARVEDAHPYDVPAIERFEESGVADSFAQWRADAVE